MLAAVRANVSLCEAWKKQIEAGLDLGLSAKRIHEDLVREHGFAGNYQSVKRFVRRLEKEAWCRSDGWSLPRANRCRWILGPALGSSMKTANAAGRTSSGRFCVVREKATARQRLTRKPRRSCGA